MLKSRPVPHGYQFRPSIQEIFILFLLPVVNGECLPSTPFIQVDIYGENKEPWNIFDKKLKTPYWVFTKLKKKSKLRIDRTAGSGCWLARNTKEVYDNSGNLLGYHKYFTFSCKNDQWMNQENGHWIMHEFSLQREDSNDYVICEIKNKDVVGPDSKLNMKKRKLSSSKKNHEEMKLILKSSLNDKEDLWNSDLSPVSEILHSKSNDEEMELISRFSDSNHKDLSSNVTFKIGNRNDLDLDLNLNLNLMSDDEDAGFYLSHEDPNSPYICNIINNDVAGLNLNPSNLESNNEEMKLILEFSTDEEDSHDYPICNARKKDVPSLDLTLNLKSNEEAMECSEQNSEHFEDGDSHCLRKNARIDDDSSLYIFPNFESNKFDENLFKSMYENLLQFFSCS